MKCGDEVCCMVGGNATLSNYDNWCTKCHLETNCLRELKDDFIALIAVMELSNSKTNDSATLIDMLFYYTFSAETGGVSSALRMNFVMFLFFDIMPEDIGMLPTDIWDASNGDLKKNSDPSDFLEEQIFTQSSEFLGIHKCINESDYSKRCHRLKAKAKLIIDNEEFLQTFLKNAIQPTGDPSNGTGYVFIPFCKFETDTKINADYCSMFKRQFALPLTPNCFTFNGNNSTPLINKNVGPGKGLTFVLDFSLLTPPQTLNLPAKMILHEPGVPPDTKHFKTSFIEIQPGVELTYGMTAVANSASDDFNKMDISKRKCQHKEDPIIADNMFGDSFDEVS